MNDNYRSEDILDPDDDVVTALEKIIDSLESGRISAASLRVQHDDGTVQDLQIGYESDEERDQAMARMLRATGELH